MDEAIAVEGLSGQGQIHAVGLKVHHKAELGAAVILHGVGNRLKSRIEDNALRQGAAEFVFFAKCFVCVPAGELHALRRGRFDGRDHLVAVRHDLNRVTAATVHECHGIFLDTVCVEPVVEYTAVDLSVVAGIALNGGGGIAGTEDLGDIAVEGNLPCYRAAVGVEAAYIAVVFAGQFDIAVQHTAAVGIAVDQGQNGMRSRRGIRQYDIALERMAVEVQRDLLIAQVEGV